MRKGATSFFASTTKKDKSSVRLIIPYTLLVSYLRSCVGLSPNKTGFFFGKLYYLLTVLEKNDQVL